VRPSFYDRTVRSSGWKPFRISWTALREITAFITSITVLAAAVVWISQQWHSRQDWRPAEYALLANLRSTQLSAKIHAEFGQPSAREADARGIVAEYFHRHDYWLQVFYSRDTGSVRGWTVTACGTDFRPTFTLGGDRFTLWKSHMTTLTTELLPPGDRANLWRADTIHQPNRLLEYGNADGELGFIGLAFGVADVCGPKFPRAGQIVDSSVPPSFLDYEGSLAKCSVCTAMAAKAVINTYGEMYYGEPSQQWFQMHFGFGASQEVVVGPVPPW
jgi:hypothetical protein